MSAAAPIELRMPGRVDLAAVRFNPGAPRRALALHGWLDNAMSFAALAAKLPEVEITALEFAGHGRSGHLPDGVFYHFVDYCGDIMAALDYLGQPPDFVLAHSLGGAVATAFAAALPERVGKLVLIEALGPISGSVERATPALRAALLDRERLSEKKLRVFPEAELAIAARLAANRMQRHSAEALIARGLRAAGDGWVWSSDPRLTLDTPIRMSEETVRAWIGAIEAETLVIVAEQAPEFFPRARQLERFACLRRGTQAVLPGHHHLHMDDPEPVAEAIRAFLGPT